MIESLEISSIPKGRDILYINPNSQIEKSLIGLDFCNGEFDPGSE